MHQRAHRVDDIHQRWISTGEADGIAVQEMRALWRRVAEELSPLIGSVGVGALLRRSLVVNQDAHAWLGGALDASAAADLVESLCDLLSVQPRGAAIAANLAVLRTFHDLLTGLIGESLTERLLHAALSPPSAGAAGQDSTP